MQGNLPTNIDSVHAIRLRDDDPRDFPQEIEQLEIEQPALAR